MTAGEPSEFESAKGALLVNLARRAIERELGRPSESVPISLTHQDWLEQPAATFVTLVIEGRLRGCIGSLEAKRSLQEDVAGNARSAAFEDPRFPRLAVHELGTLGIEISILSEPEAVDCRSEAELLERLRPGVDGLILECGPNKATFLPQVWQNFHEPADFLAALKEKAGLGRDFRSEEICFARYTVKKYTGG